jgi:hypothetical protein
MSYLAPRSVHLKRPLRAKNGELCSPPEPKVTQRRYSQSTGLAGMLVWFARFERAKESRPLMVYRVELERLDHGYEARVPEINGFLCEGLTEGETLSRLRQKLDRYRAETGADVDIPTVRLEVYRT